MDEFKTDDEASAALPRWTGAHSTPLAHQLNEQCVELVCELANNLSAEELPPFIFDNRDPGHANTPHCTDKAIVQ